MNKIAGHYGGKLRLRVSGFIVRDQKLLLLRHEGIGSTGELWLPPGGGAEYGQSLQENLSREIREETGLETRTGGLCYIHEHLALPLHAVELFFWSQYLGGEAIKGTDPEHAPDNQIIRELRWMSIEEIRVLEPAKKHAVLSKFESFEALLERQSFFNN